jgi:hypothetical protein
VLHVPPIKTTNPQLSKKFSKKKKNLSWVTDGGLTPGQTGQLTVGHKITLTFKE